jgi:hypothetical protein
MARINAHWAIAVRGGTFKVRALPRLEKLKLCAEIAETCKRPAAARACAMNLARELFATQGYEMIPIIAKRFNLSRADLDNARKAAKRPAIAKKASEDEIDRVIQEYINDDTDDEYAEKAHAAAIALIREICQMPLRHQRR